MNISRSNQLWWLTVPIVLLALLLGSKSTLGLNSDNNLDVVFANYGQPNRACLGDGSGGFACSNVSVDTDNSSGLALGDMNGDGNPDVVFANYNSTRNRVCLGDGSGGFTCSDVSTDMEETQDVALGDVNNDNYRDAIFANYNQRNRVCLGDGAGGFTCNDVNTDMNPTTDVTLGDVNGDHNLDIVFANLGQRNRVCLGDGSGDFTCSDISTDTNDSYDVKLGNVNSDYNLDIVFANAHQPNRICLGNGIGGFTCSDVSADMNGTQGVALGDVDGDSYLDAIFANAHQPNRMCLGDGAGGFTCSNVSTDTNNSVDVALGDVDSDNDLDAIFANYSGERNRVCLGDGVGGFTCSDVSIDTYNTTAVVLSVPGATLSATFDNLEVYPGDVVTANLEIQGAKDLYAVQSTCVVNPAVLEPQSGTFGDFFDPVDRLVATNIVSPTVGTWSGAISQQNPAGPLSGDGLMATLTYQALIPGTTALTCDPIFSDRDGFTQTVSFVGADITVLPYATMTGTAVYQGRLTHAGIEVSATGPVTSTDVTNANGDFTLAQLRTGTYTVTADAASYLPNCITPSITSGETIPLTPTTLHGGDVNDYVDGGLVINIGDATLLASYFGLNVPIVNPPVELTQVDINADGVINVQDLAILAGNYEQAGCQDW